MTSNEIIIYALLWLSFGAVHSLLARSFSKQFLQPVFGRFYRFNYNLFSTLHIGLVIVGGQMVLGDNSAAYDFGSGFIILAKVYQLTGIIVIIVSLTQYDLGRFSGITQLRHGEDTSEIEPLHITGIHRYVRHPLYLGAYLYLLGGATNEFGMLTALWGCLYLLIGTWFEERSLVALYGSAYVEYQKKVPAVLPLKGRAIK